MLKELNFVMNYVFTLETWYSFFVLRRLTTFDFFTFDTTQQNTYVLTGTAFVQQFAEHFNASTGRLLSLFDTNDFNFFARQYR